MRKLANTDKIRASVLNYIVANEDQEFTAKQIATAKKQARQKVINALLTFEREGLIEKIVGKKRKVINGGRGRPAVVFRVVPLMKQEAIEEDRLNKEENKTA